MRHHRRSRLQLWSEGPANLTFDPRRTDAGPGFVLQPKRKINDIASGFSRNLPVGTGRFRIRSKKSEINVIELLGPDALNERDLILHRLELSQRFVVIQQFHIERGEIPVVEHLSYFFPL